MLTTPKVLSFDQGLGGPAGALLHSRDLLTYPTGLEAAIVEHLWRSCDTRKRSVVRDTPRFQ